jgi:hypothetical protein
MVAITPSRHHTVRFPIGLGATMSVVSAGVGRGRKSEPTTSGQWGTWAAVAAGVALLAFLLAWLFGWIRFTTDPRVAEVIALQDAARAKYEATGGPQTFAEVTDAFTTMTTIRGKIEALPEHLRPQAERAGRDVFRSMFRQRIDAYFNAPIDQRQAVLDRQIDQEEMFRKAFEAGRSLTAGAAGGGSGSGTSRGAAPGGGSGQGAAGQASRPSPGQTASRTSTEDDGNRWRKGIIDRTSPEQRARYVEYRRAVEARRSERGMSTGWSR